MIGGPFQRFVLPLRGFPRVLPVQVLRIGDAAVVGLPCELTERDRLLCPDRRTAYLRRRGRNPHVRANHEIGIEDSQKAFEIADA